MKPLRLPAVALALFAMLAGSPRIVFAQSEERILYASVVDKDGAPVPNLTEKDFIIREDGQAREVLSVTPDSDPLQVALLVDTGRGMRNNINDLRRAATAFVENMREGAQIALITLGARPTISVPYTADRAALKKASTACSPRWTRATPSWTASPKPQKAWRSGRFHAPPSPQSAPRAI
jgi:hypothetical protein